MSTKTVAGIYIERDGATVVIARHAHHDIRGHIGPELDVVASDYYEWPSRNPDAAVTGIERATRDIADAFPETYSIAVAAIGPFVSLQRTSSDYGRVHRKYGDDTFKDINLYQVVRQQLLSCGMPAKTKVSVHTDAHGFALGEAINRHNKRNHIIVSILATEGVGGGIVRGNSTFQSALHPEMGLALPRFDKNDPLKPASGDRMFAKSIEQLASNSAMRKRYALETGVTVESVENEDLLRWRDPQPWDFRAYYLAQLTFFCATFLTPHQIVVASDLDPTKSLVRDVKRYFDLLTTARQDDKQPMLDYPGIKNAELISELSEYRHQHLIDKYEPCGIHS